MAFIYRVLNLENGKSYIGKTNNENPYVRFNEHVKDSKKIAYKNRPLYKAMSKYGYKSFYFYVLEETDIPEEREVFYISLYNSFGKNGYNATKGGDGKPYLKCSETEVIEFYKTSRSAVNTANNFGIDRATVRAILSKNGVPSLTRQEVASKNYGKPIVQIDTATGNIIGRFLSINEAAVALGGKGKSRQITRALRGDCNYALGFTWKYC